MTVIEPSALTPTSPGRARWPVWASGALAALAAAAVSLALSVFPLDDAYITLHNARALLAGGGDASYGGSALTGATSAVHLALVTLFGLVMPLETAMQVVGAIAVALYVAGLDRLASRAGVSRIIFVAAGLSGFLPVQLVNGLETGLAVAALAWTLVLIDDRRLPLLLGTLPFIRPELALLAAPLMLRRAWLDPRRIVGDVAMAVAAAAPWLGFYWLTTGSPIPNTGGAKIPFFAEARMPAGEKLAQVARALVFSALAPMLLVGVAGLRRMPGGAAIILFLAAWLFAAGAVLPGGLAHNEFRYLALAVPLLAYGLIPFLRPPYRRRAMVLILLYAFASAAFGAATMLVQPDSARRLALGADAALLPRGARVLVHDAGYLAWVRPDLRLIDVVGLKTPASAFDHARLTAPTGSRGEALDRIARRARAEYIVVLVANRFWAQIATGLTARGWQLTPVNDPASAYVIYRIVPPAGV